MNHIKLTQTNTWRIALHLDNGKTIGTFEILDDGYFYYYFPDILVPGAVDSSLLKEIAEKLEEVNEPWDKIVEQGLAKPVEYSSDPFSV